MKTPPSRAWRNRARAALLGAVSLGLSGGAFAGNTLDLEGGYVIPGYNDVAIPGDSGTRFSLTEDLDADDVAAFRFRYGHTFATNHWMGVLVAPLTMKSHGTFDEDVAFNGETFAGGTPVDSEFRFDSYRLIYRYLFHQSAQWSFSFGAAAKLRDAAIRLEGGGQEAEKSNTGVVPLLSFNATWTPVERWHLLMDGEALAAPQGRAEDVLFAAQYDVSRSLALKAGYRILEGGSDNDDVYTFSLFHYVVAGAVWSF